MKLRFTKSLSEVTAKYMGVANIEDRGLTARVVGAKGKTLMIILPCGHTATLDGWTIEGIDTDKPTASPSIFCKGLDGKDCWHGWLKEGELKQV